MRGEKYRAAIVGGEFGNHVPQGTEAAVLRARELRHEATCAEQLLWERLRGRQVANAKFRRQHPIGRFIADFYCHSARLVIELDGGIHDTQEQIERDALREEILRNSALNILRFSNNAVRAEMDGVIKRIEEVVLLLSSIRLPSPPLPPSPIGMGEERVEIEGRASFRRPANQTPPSPIPMGEGGRGGEGR